MGSVTKNKIDTHQHFWQYNPVKDAWITEEMKVIQRDFLPSDLEPLLRQTGFDGCVAVQADQSENETAFLLQLAGENDFIKGVVGWIDLQARNITERLEYYTQFEKLKGFRHILQAEPRRDLMLTANFQRGIRLLHQYNFTYDILIYTDQLPYIKTFVAAFPEQPFVIDHLAKPDIKKGTIDDWKKNIADVARFENVYCKISGMVTEADWQNWKKEDFRLYIDAVVEAFGTDRLLFGSDWPVCLVAAGYEEVLSICEDYYSGFSADEKKKIFRDNAIRFYQL
jgi:L-fuconolactonase